jgi:hypothetical protein
LVGKNSLDKEHYQRNLTRALHLTAADLATVTIIALNKTLYGEVYIQINIFNLIISIAKPIVVDDIYSSN